MKTRAEFKKALITHLKKRGEKPDEKNVNSALGKLARHAKQKYGNEGYWEDEHREQGIESAIAFHDESKTGTADTFNRQTKGWRGWKKAEEGRKALSKFKSKEPVEAPPAEPTEEEEEEEEDVNHTALATEHYKESNGDYEGKYDAASVKAHQEAAGAHWAAKRAQDKQSSDTASKKAYADAAKDAHEATKKAIETGTRGGKFYLSDNGSKVYVKSKK